MEKSVGQAIKILRKSLKLNQSEFSERIGITQTAISKIELGESNPDLRTLKVISSEFNVNYNWLIGIEPNMYDLKQNEQNNFAPVADDAQFWRELAMSQQQILVNLTKSNGTLSESNKIIADSNSKSLDIVETISKKILSLLQSDAIPKGKAKIH